MRKTFLPNLVLVIAVNLLVKPFYILGIEAEIQNRTGAEVYGSYFALISFSFLLNIIPDLGTTNWNTRSIAQEPHLLRVHLPKLLTLRVILAVVYILVMLVCSLTLGYSMGQIKMLMVLGINQILASSILFLRSNLAGLHLFKQDSLVSVLDRAILVLAMALLLWAPGMSGAPFRIEWLVWGQTAAYSLTLVICLILVLTHAGRIRLSWNTVFARTAIVQSAPYAALILISSITLRIDSVLLERLHSPEEAGYYAMGFRFFDAFNMIAYLFAALLLPLFARMLAQREDISSLLGQSFRIMSAGSWILLLVCFSWKNEIISLIYDHPDPRAILAFGWLMTGSMFFSLQYIFGTLLTAAGRMGSMIKIALIGMVVNLVINILCIPSFGAVGAGAANALAQGLVLLMQARVVSGAMRTDIRPDSMKVLRFSAGSLVLVIVAHYVYQLIETEFHFILEIAIFLVFALLLAFLSGVIGLRGQPSFFRREE